MFISWSSGCVNILATLNVACATVLRKTFAGDSVHLHPSYLPNPEAAAAKTSPKRGESAPRKFKIMRQACLSLLLQQL